VDITVDGALAVYLDGQPVVDVWTGWSDRAGRVPWSADSARMVFSATKGMASTVIHRLADRGLIDCDTPVAHYWPQFAANGKAELSVRQVMQHQAGLSSLRGATLDQLLDHFGMEERLAGSPTRAAEIIAPQNIVGNPLEPASSIWWANHQETVEPRALRASVPRSVRPGVRRTQRTHYRTDGPRDEKACSACC
jgi:CubicO group peptidase (beta-lactamase class C family)